jgi:hypothetical protein
MIRTALGRRFHRGHCRHWHWGLEKQKDDHSKLDLDLVLVLDCADAADCRSKTEIGLQYVNDVLQFEIVIES